MLIQTCGFGLFGARLTIRVNTHTSARTPSTCIRTPYTSPTHPLHTFYTPPAHPLHTP